MFCPKCATQNIDGASFCRVCGANISLVPKALNGELSSPEQDFNRRVYRRWHREPSVEHGMARVMSGLGFLAVALCIAAFAPAGRVWWFWLLIPAFSLVGKGIAEFMRARDKMSRANMPPQIESKISADQLSQRETGQLRPSVPSVTEGTTRHLGREASPIDPYQDQKPS